MTARKEAQGVSAHRRDALAGVFLGWVAFWLLVAAAFWLGYGPA